MLESIVPPRLNEAIQTVINRDKTIDARPGPDYERLFTQAKHEATEMEHSVAPVYDEFKDLTFDKVKSDDSKYVKQLVSTGPNSCMVFIGKKHGDDLYTGKAYEMVDNDISYAIYGTFNGEKSGTHETFSSHGVCRVDFVYLKKSHHVDHRYIKMQNNKPEVERLEYTVLNDGSKQFQWMIGAWPSHNHPTFFVNEKGTLRVSREKSPGVYKVFCIRQSKELVSIEMYYVDKENNLIEKFEQIKYDSNGKYYHRSKGKGVCVLNPNLRYEGRLGPRFELTGNGRMILFSPSRVISGKFDDGKIVEGIVETDKYQYTGQIKDSLPNGKGHMNFHDKDWGEGEFKDGYQVGKGRFYSNCSQSDYEGEFKDGHKSGKGVETFQNGDKYEGDFKEGQFCGTGVMHFNNGDVYKGGFDRGVFNGKGVLQTNEATIDTKWTHGKLGEQSEENLRVFCAGDSSPMSHKTKVN